MKCLEVFGSLKNLELFGFHKKWNPESDFGLDLEKKLNSSFGSSSGSGNQSWFWSGSR
jgi:hypothetical protein